MAAALHRLARSVGLLAVLAIVGASMPGDIAPAVVGIAFVLVGVPYFVLSGVDLLVALEEDPRRTPLRRALMVVLSMPVALLGLTSLLFGAAIILWVLYNLVVERQPGFGHWTWWQPLGIGPLLVAFGVMTMRRALCTRLEVPAPIVSEDAEDGSDDGWDDDEVAPDF